MDHYSSLAFSVKHINFTNCEKQTKLFDEERTQKLDKHEENIGSVESIAMNSSKWNL